MIDYNKKLNKKIITVKPSGIRKFFDIANELDDVISLSVGEPDFKTPYHIRQEGINELELGNTRYTPNRGFIKLRQEIANFYLRKYNVRYNPTSDVLVTVGGSEAIDLGFRVMLNAGDEVIIPEPSFVCYVPLTQMAGGVPVIINTKQENNFRLTVQEIESHITDKTKAIVMPFPNNPTGAVMRKEDLEDVCEVIKKYDLFVISDEIYSELTYGEDKHVSIASIEGMQERTIVINGFSKSHSMTGWRMGYALGPSEIIAQMTKLHQFGIMSAPTISQYAAIDALKNGDADIIQMKAEYDKRRKYIVDRLNKIGLTCANPEGAFYVFPCIKSTGLSSTEFCERLIYEKHVAVVPGDAFGESGEGYVRISYSYSIEHIEKALDRIEEFVNELKADK